MPGAIVTVFEPSEKVIMRFAEVPLQSPPGSGSLANFGALLLPHKRALGRDASRKEKTNVLDCLAETG